MRAEKMEYHQLSLRNNAGFYGPPSTAFARTSAPSLRQLSHKPVELDTDDVLHERTDFRIRLADTRGQRSKASLLINRMYSWRGYQTEGAVGLGAGPNQISLVASRDDVVFGTLTVGLDSDAGLLVDQLYADKINAFRAEGRTICEFGKLAVDPNYGTKDVLAALFHLAFMYAHRINNADDIVIEVNPRHVAYYKRMLGFNQAGPQRMCDRVSAPAVLLHLPCSYAAEQIARHGGHQTTEGRSLYPYFFSEKEEEGLRGRLKRLGAEDRQLA
jgi:hypothetical protein